MFCGLDDNYLVFFVLGVSQHSTMFDCNKEYDSTFDIYLGGSCGDSEWRENIAIPMMR